ncbi:MAG: hypothetical protein Q9160_006685 [Pyrenula sp. 1 TL-2023]
MAAGYADPSVVSIPTKSGFENALEGIHMLSSSVGWVTDYLTEALLLNGSSASLVNTSNIPSADSTVQFPSVVECLGIRLTVWNSSFTYFGNIYTRINELSPLYVDSTGPASATSQLPSPPGAKPQQSAQPNAVPNDQSQPAPERKDSTGIIIGGVGGSIIAVLLIALTAARIRRRYRRRVPQIWERKQPRSSVMSVPQLVQDPSGMQNAESGVSGAWMKDRLTDKGFKFEAAEIRPSGAELNEPRTPLAELPDMIYDREGDGGLRNYMHPATIRSTDSSADNQRDT